MGGLVDAFSLQCLKRKAVQCSTNSQAVSSKTLWKMDSTRTGWAELSTSPPSQLNYILCHFFLFLYTFVKCCLIDTKKKSPLVIWLPALVSCQLSSFSPLLFLVHHPSSLYLCLLSSPFFSLCVCFSVPLSFCFLKLFLSASPSAQNYPIPHWLPVLFLPSSSLHVELFTCPSCLLSALLSPCLWLQKFFALAS